jgi:hypothetical protein
MAGGGDDKMKGAWACVTGASSGIGMSALDPRICSRPWCESLHICKAGSSSVGFKGNVADAEPVLRPGRAIALALAGEGMNLKLVGRSTDKLQKVLMMSRQPVAPVCGLAHHAACPPVPAICKAAAKCQVIPC